MVYICAIINNQNKKTMKNYRVSIGFRVEGFFENLETATSHASTLSGSVVNIKNVQTGKFEYSCYHHEPKIYTHGFE